MSGKSRKVSMALLSKVVFIMMAGMCEVFIQIYLKIEYKYVLIGHQKLSFISLVYPQKSRLL